MAQALHFVKYQGAGNDFVMVDDRSQTFPAGDYRHVEALCHRRFGIGADGLILLQEALSPATRFTMVYYNSDGNLSTFCGNGGRCIVAFAAEIGLVEPGETIAFSATDGVHEAVYFSQQHIELAMRCTGPPILVELADGVQGFYLNTGSPHVMIEVAHVDDIDVKKVGALYRHDHQFAPHGGVNINFVQRLRPDHLRVRTYERGVEDETYSCGTGVTASALWAAPGQEVAIETPGGLLSVRSKSDLSDIYLIGPGERVFAGTYS
jgi:diaminopimelate epimerase